MFQAPEERIAALRRSYEVRLMACMAVAVSTISLAHQATSEVVDGQQQLSTCATTACDDLAVFSRGFSEIGTEFWGLSFTIFYMFRTCCWGAYTYTLQQPWQLAKQEGVSDHHCMFGSRNASSFAGEWLGKAIARDLQLSRVRMRPFADSRETP